MPRGIPKKVEVAKPDAVQLVVMQSKMDKTLEGLDERVKAEVKAETQAFLQAREVFGNAGLEMGRHLARVRDLLEPIKRWKLWVRTVPTMSTSTAYRFINTWENAQKTLPPATLKVALLGGHRIISQDKDAGFLGTYEQAAKNVTARLGPPPAENEQQAKKWIDELLVERRRIVKLAGADANQEPLEIEPLEMQIVTRFENLLERIPEDRRSEFASRVIGMLMTAAKGTVTIGKLKPVPLPETIEAPRAVA